MRHLKTAALALAIILMATTTIAYAMSEKPSHTGKVIEATTSGPYTYINVDENGEKYWIAAPTTYVLAGKTITFEEDLWMPNFKSKSLDRTFDRILFVTGVYVHKAGEKTAPKTKAKAAPKKTAATATKTPAKDAGTFTVEDVYGKLGKLDGNIITVKGKVVKVSQGILGRDWVHVQDGTGEEGSTNNLVFRTAIGASPKVDDEVTAKGRLEIDKDFGMGYFYNAIVEDATVTK
jgi:hypothetical protein